jgi:YVTN family beta-propeller protein
MRNYSYTVVESRKTLTFIYALFIGCLTAVLLGAACPAAWAGAESTSAARRVAPGDLPLNLIVVPEGYLVSTNSGYGRQYLQAFDEKRGIVTDKLELPSLWYGLAYDPLEKVLLASSVTDTVYVVPFSHGQFGKAHAIVLDGCRLTAGIAIQTSPVALVACNQNHSLVQFDYSTDKLLRRAPTGEFPYSVLRLPGNRIAVSNWGSASLVLLDENTLQTVATIPVGSHPNQMVLIPKTENLVVACSDADVLSVVDLHELRETRRVSLRTTPDALLGAQPNGLAYDSAKRRLYVALANVHSVAAFDVEEGPDGDLEFAGRLSVGTYPTSLVVVPGSGNLYIANGRNLVTGPNAPVHPGTKKYPYIGSLLGGSIEVLSPAALTRHLVKRAVQSMPVRQAAPTASNTASSERYFSATTNPGNPIRYVFYVIKENRTYDQVLGDIGSADGDPRLVLFGEDVTPNQHALAQEFILFDNFFVDGDVSADGHFWSTAAVSTEYVSKLWPSEYSKRTTGLLEEQYDGDADHDHPIAAPASGFLWDLAAARKIPFRNYGEWNRPDEKDPNKDTNYLTNLKDNFDPLYRDVIGDVTDQQRLDEWQREFREFEKTGALPRLNIIHLPNDHTMGTRPGSATPRAMVADNDLALGRLVATISKSRFWPASVIFVLEDDAQSGPDHVDAHRSPLLVISPYTHRHAIEHRRFSTVSVLKTIETILGLNSMTIFDQQAVPLFSVFQRAPESEPYEFLQPRVSLDEKNASDAPGAAESAQWDFSRPDNVPELALNRVIWQSIRGAGSVPPATRMRIP